MLLISRCAEMVNVNQNLTPQQIEFAAEYIVENSWTYSLDDLQICFDSGCMGKYGELYNRLDPSVIMGWLAKYEQERNLVIAEQRKKETTTNNIYDVFNNDVMADALRTVVDKLKMKEESTDVPLEPRRDPTPFEKQIMDEWDKLERDETTPQFRVYGSSWYDFSAYRIMRYKQEWNNQEDEE